MKIYNTLSRKKEEFKTIEENKVRMYVCGPTVYNYIHIGNARPLVFFDTVRRYLEYKNYNVKFVMNLTDIDDKIIDKANEEGVEFTDITKTYIAAFLKNAEDFNVDVDKIIKPQATNYIDDMINFISDLEKQGAAYDASTTVYFNIDSAENYGKLSKKNIEELELGSRIDVSGDKKNPMDFALWKKQKYPNEPAWDSPWGKGRPGWHIECSTMAKSVLGETIDIHGGGEDLQFPHHENEIAQSETLNKKPFANYWMHNSMITVDKEKMSKSKGNFFTIHDIEKEFDLMIVRMWLLSGHYRTPIDFSRENLLAIKNAYDRLKNTNDELNRFIENSNNYSEFIADKIDEFEIKFSGAMDDDFNTANALAVIFDFSRFININYSENSSKKELEYVKNKFDILVDLLGIKFKNEILEEEIENLIAERTEARKKRDFKRADEIRDLLKEKGIELKDTSTGVMWNKL
ncbi:cysteine--tRNA ligase [Helcococcus ovis]|uniref:Cysteine--tRNA ligase n=2 Tax=Bacteria TaxID=2 RepID=A0A4R9C1L7_9FIRM|nr:cysteine--tRNA ligase [Helcococcus ovis]TFF64291.1 cysteine--tRNA ligase [Helcococcus ovis]TFF66550.1 cysteine--tRNA ligase [Helcococcus ovis]TFF68870.1 cysteine--tRNA ligase [Helcococcus ovis]WNZ00699.1 cysteine--tRNA ligase [Helcococcus ovis]